MNTQFLRSCLVSSLAATLILQAAIAHADDTEIFFGGSAIDEGIRPNVLFILDNSGSMTGTDGTSTTRMDKLKSAFNQILTNSGNINIGVMSLNDAPRLLSPVQNIDTPLNVKLSTPAILVSGDDASRVNNASSTNISDPTLVMGYVQGPSGNTVTRSLGSTSPYSTEDSSYYLKTTSNVAYSCNVNISSARKYCDTGAKTILDAKSQKGLFLFRNLNIPAGATITSATLSITPANTRDSKPSMSIALENSKAPEAYNDASSIASRTFTSTTTLTGTAKLPTDNWVTGTPFVLNIADEIKVLLNNTSPTGNPIGDLGLQLSATGSNNTYNYNVGDVATAPSLTITFTSPTSTTRTTGLRFENVAIPKGATITSARIDFVPAASDDRAVTFDVTAQNIADATIFSTGENFTTRTKTANSVTWSPSEWRTSSPRVYVEGPTVTGLVQNVIDSNSTWCGNNSMAFFITPTSGSGSRTALSIDTASGLQPILNVTYAGGDSGCLNPILDISIIDAKDDASQTNTTSSSNWTPSLTATTLPFSDKFIAARYQKVPVKQGAKVISAQVFVTPNTTTTGVAALGFENTGDSAAFAAAKNNLSNRSPSSTVSCTITPSTVGTQVEAQCADFKSLVQNIFAKSTWADGNALTMMLQPTSGNGLSLRTYESNVSSSIKLRLKLESGGLGTNSYTVRDYTKGIVEALNPSGNTPIVPTLYDAASYLVQTPGLKPSGAAASPITSSCQANYLVLLTDGEANNGRTYTTPTSAINTLTSSGNCAADASDSDEKCGRTLVSWMAETDLADYEGLNTVITHTIGFNTSSNAQATRFLEDLATAGKGEAYAANDAAELASAFNDIVQTALATNTTFVNSSAPVNSFNRADNLDQLYFALFQPSEKNRWAGNLKRYRLRTADGVATIVDADNAAAIDAKTGFFKSNARSFWSTSQDGDKIALGGAASKLPEPASRNLYTSIGGNLQSLVRTNTAITKTLLGDASMTDDARINLINYIRGLDTDNTTARQAMGDPIHSSPRLVNYGCKDPLDSEGNCASPDISAVMGTNEGYLHSVNTSTGVEEYAIMPSELLTNIQQLRADAKSTSTNPRRYGMDNTVALWTNDANNDGSISGPDEFVYAYATMGRGGQNIYALNITNRSAPTLLWQINGGTTTGFEKLGQTWSVPVKTRIDVGGTVRDVLIFGGGYDPDQDNLNTSTSTYTADDQGNAIYIVDAETGAKIWSAGGGSGHTLTLSKMKYSIPAPVRAIDIQESNGILVADSKKLADQFFVGDMGGQVWRFYINNGSSGASLVTPGGTSSDGVFASIGGTTAASARRFYNEPDVALLNVRGTPTLTVNIGSGYRGHPLNEYITDRFYSFRTTSLFKAASQTTLTESNLYDATNDLNGGSEFEDPNIGWYITMTRSGEKVLSRALTTGGDLFFNTYEPTTSTAACSASVGVNRSYAVSLLYATPARFTVDTNGNTVYDNSRSETSNSGGISGDPQIYCSGDECYVLPDPAVDPIKANTPPLGKTYWTDKLDLN